MRRALAVPALLALPALLGVAACDVGGDDAAEQPSDPTTVVRDPAPTEAPSSYLEFGDTGGQPDQLPGGGSPVVGPDELLELRAAADGCAVRRVGEGARVSVAGLAWMVNSAGGTRTDPDVDGRTFDPPVRGRAVVSLVVLDKTADGVIVQKVSNFVRVRC